MGDQAVDRAAALQAAEILADLGGLRRQSRRSLGRPWFPAVIFGVITLLSAPLVAAAGVTALAPLWIVVGGCGLAMTGRHYRRMVRATGVARPRRQAWPLSLSLFVLCFLGALLASVFDRVAGLVTPVVIITLGYALTSLLQRDALPVALIAPGGLAAVFVAAHGADPWVVEVIFGGALTASGGVLRACTRGQRLRVVAT